MSVGEHPSCRPQRHKWFLKAEQLRKQELSLLSLSPSQVSTRGENGIIIFFSAVFSRLPREITSADLQQNLMRAVRLPPPSSLKPEAGTHFCKGLILLLIKAQRTTSRELYSSNRVKLVMTLLAKVTLWTTATMHAPVISLPCRAVATVFFYLFFYPLSESCCQRFF